MPRHMHRKSVLFQQIHVQNFVSCTSSSEIENINVYKKSCRFLRLSTVLFHHVLSKESWVKTSLITNLSSNLVHPCVRSNFHLLFWILNFMFWLFSFEFWLIDFDIGFWILHGENFWGEILDKNIAIIAIQQSRMDFVRIRGVTVEWNSRASHTKTI